MKWLIGCLMFFLSFTTVAFGDRPAVHGMLVFGKSQIYASHLPMFHQPHDYQVLLALEWQNQSGSQAIEEYGRATAEGAVLFTLVPEVMDLTQLMNGAKVSFDATIFHGHFERGGASLGAVRVTVTDSIYSQKLNGEQPSSLVDRYVVFGAEGEYFAAHVIQEKPSFDTIVRVKQPVDARELPVVLSMPKVGGVSQMLEKGTMLGQFDTVQTEVLDVIYYEADELAF